MLEPRHIHGPGRLCFYEQRAMLADVAWLSGIASELVSEADRELRPAV